MQTTDLVRRSSTGAWLGAAALLQLALPWVLARVSRRAAVLDDADCHTSGDGNRAAALSPISRATGS